MPDFTPSAVDYARLGIIAMFVRNLNPIGITESPAKQNFAFAPSIQFTFVLKRKQYYAAKVLLIVISKRIIFEGFFFAI
jgi:hypothetical protein